MAEQQTCHMWRYGFWWSPSTGLRMPLFASYCHTCGAELRPDGTSGPSAAELAARLASADADTRRLDALETALSLGNIILPAERVPGGFEVSDSYTVATYSLTASGNTLRALADALEVDAQ